MGLRNAPHPFLLFTAQKPNRINIKNCCQKLGPVAMYEHCKIHHCSNGEKVRYDAIGYRNGLGRVVLMKTTLPEFGVGRIALVPDKCMWKNPTAHHDTRSFERDKVQQVTYRQATPEWFVARRE